MTTTTKTLAIVLLLGATVPPLTQAQQQAEPAMSAPAVDVLSLSGGQQEPAENNFRVPVPSIVSIDGTPLIFLSELERANYLRGGVSLGSSYDDNIFNASSDTTGEFAFTALPHIAFDLSRSRLRFKTEYAAGVTVHQRLSSQNNGAHDLAADFDYRLSPHITLSLRENFAITNGFMNQAPSDLSTNGNGILQQPNSYVVTPIANETSNNGSAQLSYQFGAGSMVGVSGSSFISRYRDVPAGSSLLDTTSGSFAGFYAHRVTPRNWVGVRYGLQRFNFDPVSEQSTTQSILYFHTIYLKRNLELAFFAGPEYTELDGHTVSPVVHLPYVLLVSTPTTNGDWNVAAGSSLSWQGQRTAAQAQFVRRISDGGGLQATVNLNAVSGEISRQLTSKTTFTVGASYASMDPLSIGSSLYRVTDSAGGRFSVSRQMGSNLALMLGYGRDWQQSAGTAASNVNHNRGWITLTYDFTRPLGR